MFHAEKQIEPPDPPPAPAQQAQPPGQQQQQQQQQPQQPQQLTPEQTQARNTLVNAQDAARTNPNFQPEPAGQRRTFCNQATAATASAVGAPTTPLQDARGNAYLANQQAQNLANSPDYQVVNGNDVQALANEGALVIGAQQNPRGHGHVATVRPENVTGDPAPAGNGPLINQIGRHVGIRHESGSFNRNPPVIYYTPVRRP
jgi:outer membrane biosynthesis protein TonB